MMFSNQELLKRKENGQLGARLQHKRKHLFKGKL